ncbi:MAG: Carbamoyl-phosphate synthase small chain [Desulfotomaculum sp. 46_296]|nr:MAG: Carbamoyl-phosphate synthase small chain [Desulfotomaculum sp. 46_296]HAU30866.1 carbamoyl phosphate synthase small subunit [Desulfotomaculum sp.]
MKASLALEDGTIFTGNAFGAQGAQYGEVVFNTGMTGYQEILTDPSYCGQIVVMTYPLIGNYGINTEDFESKKSGIRGFVVYEECERPSNWRSGSSISDFLFREGIIGLSGIDTRSLTLHLRNFGTMRGVISTENKDPGELVREARNSPFLSGQDLASAVAAREVYIIEGTGHRVVLFDLGSKQNIIRHLQKRNCEIVVVPPKISVKEVLSLQPDGILISNGPGDPADVPYTTATIKELITRMPAFGICLGHQILALALGAKTYKMKFGHRGANHPVKDLRTSRVYITSHNHGYSVEEKSLENLPIEISHRNLNDGTIEGIRHKYLPVFSVQYHPEASPGPQESACLFDEYIDLMRMNGSE